MGYAAGEREMKMHTLALDCWGMQPFLTWHIFILRKTKYIHQTRHVDQSALLVSKPIQRLISNGKLINRQEMVFEMRWPLVKTIRFWRRVIGSMEFQRLVESNEGILHVKPPINLTVPFELTVDQ